MIESYSIEITELAVLGEQFPIRLMQLGYRLMQVIDDTGLDMFRYVVPPVCEVPAGPFLIGSSLRKDHRAYNNELPQHTIIVEAFKICAHPLTVAEYDCFVKATAHLAPLAWGSQGRRPDHPVVLVSWEDVLAYTQWLAQVTGESWRLPTEVEWEKAARGTDGRFYPWGNKWDTKRANTRDGGVGKTTPVGSYPRGVSPYGAHDMAGNVWEWTSTACERYPYQANDGREDLKRQAGRVSRGGSWNAYRRNARVSSRGGPSTGSSYIVGARLVHLVNAGRELVQP